MRYLLALCFMFVFSSTGLTADKAKSKDVLGGIEFTNFFTHATVPSKDVVWFACRNIVNNRYLVNKDRTKFCWIKNPAEFGEIFKGLGLTYKREETVAGTNCPDNFQSPPYCDPKKLRDF